MTFGGPLRFVDDGVHGFVSNRRIILSSMYPETKKLADGDVDGHNGIRTATTATTRNSETNLLLGVAITEHIVSCVDMALVENEWKKEK